MSTPSAPSRTFFIENLLMTGLNTATLAHEHTAVGEIEAVSQKTVWAQHVIVTAQ